MEKKEKTSGIVVVSGDVTIDWNIATTSGFMGGKSTWDEQLHSSAYDQPGGAVLLADLVKEIVQLENREERFEVRNNRLINKRILPGDKRFHHSYALWAPFPFSSSPSPNKEKPAWRVSTFLGYKSASTDTKFSVNGGTKVVDDDPSAELVVLSEGNLGFRDNPDIWPQAVNSRDHEPWIILKMSPPVAQGQLWHKLIKEHPTRLVVITTINDLRRSAVQISRGLSWESTAQDVLWELTHNPQINGLTQSACVIISLDAAGSIILTKDNGNASVILLFDPFNMEWEWERQYPRLMVGYTTCMTATQAYQIMTAKQEKPDWVSGAQRGLAAIRTLHSEGYGLRGAHPSEADLFFPIQKFAEGILQDSKVVSQVSIQDPTRFLLEPRISQASSLQKPNYWTILEENYSESLENIAFQIGKLGIQSVVNNVPIGQFGALCTMDRLEIEAFHGIQRLISEYCQCAQKQPLSIAVFGPPGAGKSFGVRQVAKTIMSDIATLTFNLSQLVGLDDLLDAFHQVRDATISGKIPLVFWDEFDTTRDGQPLGWLRYFLVPMQDGVFQQGQIIHPIGRCIFVFAGGTSHSIDKFGMDLSENEKHMSKLPDFVSRLKGYLNVVGPNPQGDINLDPYYILRRAILLRSLIKHNVPGILQKQDARIDPGILRAFLKTRMYKHGVRSMESILAMSSLANTTAYERSSLPPERQLELHVDAADFLSIVQEIELKGELLENLAKATHEIYCEELKTNGYSYGPHTDEEKKLHSSLLPYDQLPDEEKEQNRNYVRHISTKLNQAGYVMRPARSNERPYKFPGDDFEKLAQIEHQRWMNQKLSDGWKHADKTEKKYKTHTDIKEWERLSEIAKNRDYTLIRAIPLILAKAGYALEKMKAS
ncbi:MAG TPA: ATPase [Anaerolineae bacterium]|nr:ATPase [Anaerolineae bacterium]